MAGFIRNLQNSITGKNDPEKMLMKEINGIEFRKQSLINPLTQEINQANNHIGLVMHKIGNDVYDAHKSSADTIDGLSEHFETIDSYKKFIVEKEAKIKEFTERYDEEINILKSNLVGSAPPAATGDGSYCSNCGEAYQSGVDQFCGGCGSKLG